MNQILTIDNKEKKRKSKPLQATKAAGIFATFLIVFGIASVGSGAYGIYRNSKGLNTENLPLVYVDRVNDKVSVNVNGVEIISNFKYNWNESYQTVVPISSTNLEQTISLPYKNSTLNIVIEEESGRKITYSKYFEIEGMDLVGPVVTVDHEQEEGDLVIRATDNVGISHIIYTINDEESIRIDKSSFETTVMNYVLTLPLGENTLTIEAYDTSGNCEIWKKNIVTIQSEKTYVDKLIDGDKLVVTIKDEDGIKNIDINFNGEEFSGEDINQTEVKLQFTLEEGVNTLNIKVIDNKDVLSEGTDEFNYAN